MLELIPEVVDQLARIDGGAQVVLTFFKQVKDGKFPLYNIAFLLWCEVVRWFDCKSTTNMRYSNQTKTFWKLGWRLFGGKFVHFMSGYKSHGDLVMKKTEPGNFSPQSSEINFAIPGIKVLKEFDPFTVEGERSPGMYSDIMSVLSKNMKRKSACLTFDGKKLKQGLDPESGDVDLLGFEENKTLDEKKHALKATLDKLRGITEEIENYDSITDLLSLSVNQRDHIKDVLMSSLTGLSQDMFALRDIRSKKEYCKAKLIERGGESDWRKGRYVYAVSSINAFIYDIDNCLQKASSVCEDICKCTAFLNNAVYKDGRCIDISNCSGYKSLEQLVIEESSTDDTRYLKQRSDAWFELRKSARVTGSTFYTAIGADGLSKMKIHFEKVVCNMKEKDHSSSVMQSMDHGTKNEINATATLVGKVLPVIAPDLILCEEGCVIMKHKGKPFLVVSPDGSLRKNSHKDTTQVAIEIKCPVNKVHSKFPPRYLLQCLSEIEALEVDHLLYISWTSEETTVFRVNRDEELFKEALDIAVSIYASEAPKKPTKLSKSQHSLKQKITKASENVHLIGRFSSLKVGTEDHNVLTSVLPLWNINSLLSLCRHVQEVTNEFYETKRERATEAMVFLVADLDRGWMKDQIKCSPVCWFPKGYSLSTDILRQIVEDVHNKCHQNDIHIPCQSFDGQWHNLVIRSVDGKPLTILQLQKDVWQEVEKLKKPEVVKRLRDLNKEIVWLSERQGTRKRTATNAGIRLPTLRPTRVKVQRDTENCNDVNQKNTTTLADVLPIQIKEINGLTDNVLSMTEVSDTLERDAFSGNVSEDRWADELACLVDTDSDQLTSSPEETECRNTDAADHNSVRCASSKIKLEEEDMRSILALFKTTKDCNKKGKWDKMEPLELLEYFKSAKTLKTFLDVELRAVIRYIKRTKNMNIKESATKQVKIERLANALNIALEPESSSERVTRRKQNVKTLAEITSGILMKKCSKEQLNIAYAEYLWEQRFINWISEISAITIDGDTCDWFYKPEYSKIRNQFEVKCIDSTHLLTRTRRKSCKGGLDGQSNFAWIKVAKDRKTLLTPVMVEDVTDPMSVSMAITHFSEPVEEAMRGNGDMESADLCRDIRMWWISEDSPGVDAKKRIEMRRNLRKRLLDKVEFCRFPPPTMFINGWPIQLWEGMLASMDAKIWLHALCHGGSYNVRAFSSMIGETFFSELTSNDRRGHGTVSCKEFGQFIGSTIEQVQIRLDPERKFSYCTKRSTVYKLVEDTEDIEYQEPQHGNCFLCTNGRGSLPQDIISRDHKFDKQQRRRLPGRRKGATISTDRNSLQKGSLGVRWEKARCDQSKILPSKRMGIEN